MVVTLAGWEALFVRLLSASRGVFSAQDAVDVRTGWHGSRYMVHQSTTRTYQYAAKPVPKGLRLGSIASAPALQADWAQVRANPGLGFPGHTYQGRYTYRYAVHPISPDVEAHRLFTIILCCGRFIITVTSHAEMLREL